ncbi:MAG TPA: hypothetical protein VFN67_20895 [Polyangiales bacterium]|nr:hypothetical protein [Polyangiales bacterium]
MTRLPQLLSALVLFVATSPTIAHACPMCFAGGDQNQDAFLYGSIFLMFTPVLALGSLGYWAYRRITAIDGGILRPDAEAPISPQHSGSDAVVLPIAPRR